MASSASLIDAIKTLWWKTTGLTKWCRCRICRDEMLNDMNPPRLTEASRKLRIHKRNNPKVYKCKPCYRSKCHCHENDCEVGTVERRSQNRKNINDHYIPGTEFTTEFLKTAYHKIQAKERNKRDDHQLSNTRPILSSAEKILGKVAEWTPLKTTRFNEDVIHSQDEKNKLYTITSRPIFTPIANHLYYDDSSMSSYGTITSEELREAFQKSRRANTTASNSFSNHNQPQPTCIEDNYYPYVNPQYASAV